MGRRETNYPYLTEAEFVQCSSTGTWQLYMLNEAKKQTALLQRLVDGYQLGEDVEQS